MYEVCACLGTRTEELRTFGRLLGMLYHGCDDVGDAKGLEALGGGGDEDIRERFCRTDPTEEDLSLIARAVTAQVPAAEDYLDGLAAEARDEAVASAPNPDPLLALVHHTRQLTNW